MIFGEGTSPGATLPFGALPGWAAADHAGAWRAFRASAAAGLSGAVALRPALRPEPDLVTAWESALRRPADLSAEAARAFFEAAFEARRVVDEGFLTGYYEPVVAGALVRDARFTAPVIDRPAWLGGLPPERMPDRAALEAYALSPEAEPVVWLADWVEVFLVQVQGSARVRLPDGTLRRLVYAGRNGLPYSSIGRRLVDTGQVSPEAMSLDVLKAWLRRAGQDPGAPGRRLMAENRSYIFFRLEAGAAPDAGPIGGQGRPLTAGTSIAVDRSLWSYGLPFYLHADAPLPGFAAQPFSGLFVAEDTGSAIVGAARIDLYLGSGPEAGSAAGRIRHRATVTVLWPRRP